MFAGLYMVCLLENVHNLNLYQEIHIVDFFYISGWWMLFWNVSTVHNVKWKNEYINE